MAVPLILLSCVSLAAASIATDESTYRNDECRQLLRECEGAQCLLLLINNPECADGQRLYKNKRATRSKIRQILVDSYLNRMG
ncbi:unnamed protein product [Heligmosomoides polygyrus]|uniref:Conopeptide n=1 Tax=Heligmosomoides polygyrus TaxID=6339 RepID=A0A183FMM6_HELPZ|nr:unnamed protein product [Heligmosomoides polygyrus]